METRDARIYVGRLEAGQPVVYAVDGARAEPLHASDSAMAWGAAAGPAERELARVLLTDAAGAEPPAEVCGRFVDQVLSRLPQDGFALQRDTVKAWLRRYVAV